MLVVAGSVTVEGVRLGVDQLVYLAPGRDRIRLTSAGARVMLLGGTPFDEAWDRRDPRFPPVVDRGERVMEAPPMPTVALKPRPSQRSRP